MPSSQFIKQQLSSFETRPFRRFSLGFRLLEGLVFAPFIAWIGQVLRGQAVVDSTALVGFFLSPRGFAAALISAAIFLTIRFSENAGLSVLVAAQAMHKRPTAWLAFKHVVARSSALARGTLFIISFGLVLLTPLAVTAGVLSHRLLSQHDINYYLQAKPPEFVSAALVLAVIILMTVAIGLRMAIRWRWVAQVLMFETSNVATAFRRSASLAQPVWKAIAWRWVAVGLVNLVLGAAAAWISRLVLPLALGVLGEGSLSIGFIFGGLWMMQALIGASFTLMGAILEAQVFTRFYLRVSGHSLEMPAIELPKSSKTQSSRWIPAVAMLILIAIGGTVGSIWGTSALFAERPMWVIAHRASVTDAPENTVAAIQQAIQDGADVAEIDVQLSRDGVIVVAHDSDFSRTAGIAKKVSELTWAEIARMDVGRSFTAKFHGTRPSRLDEVLAAARGRIRLNIELKHYAAVDGKLENKVVRMVEQSGAVSSVEMQSLEYEALTTVRQLNPAIRIGYLMSVNARRPEKLPVDFLSVQMSRVDAHFLRRAHQQGHQVYVWTVDDERQMEKALALGVDGLITNRSKRAAEFVREWISLSPTDKAVRRLKFWLAQ